LALRFEAGAKVYRSWGASAYVFGAICPAEGKGAGLVLPCCNSEAMALHLEEISRAVASNAHALLLLDQAGWHVSTRRCHVAKFGM
jgi:hypothetical protein